MIYTKNIALEQISEMLQEYTDLYIEKILGDQIIITGEILINRLYNDYHLYQKYSLSIAIPLEKNELPYIIDSGHHIIRNYPHIYHDRKLCLETDTRVKLHFIDGFNLLEWMHDFVEPYYFSYEYFMKYGEFPFGERPHGTLGIVQTYREVFKESDDALILKFIKYIATNNYRGHLPCPCGSGKRTRNCHGKMLLQILNKKKLKSIITEDYITIKNGKRYE